MNVRNATSRADVRHQRHRHLRLRRGRVPWAAPRAAADRRPSRIPVRFDVRLIAPVDAAHREQGRAGRRRAPSSRCAARTTGRSLFGRVEIDRGEVFFEGNRYQVTPRHGRLREPDPHRAVLRRRGGDAGAGAGPGVSCRRSACSGTPDRASFDLSSDPPLANIDILSLLFGDMRDPQNAELTGPALARAAPSRSSCVHGRRACSPAPSRRGVGTRGRRGHRRRYRADHAVARRCVRPAVARLNPVGTPDGRQADLAPSSIVTYSRALNARSRDRDHPVGVQPERPLLVGGLAERGPHLRGRFPCAARLLTECERIRQLSAPGAPREGPHLGMRATRKELIADG